MSNLNLKKSLAVLTVTSAMAFSSVASAAISYSQDWEGTNPAADVNIADNFVIGNVNVGTGGAWFAGAAAPNSPVAGVNGYSAYVNEGGAGQGNVQLSVFSDYNPWSPFTTAGTTLQSFVYKDLGTITADMLGNTYRFAFDAKLKGATIAEAYVNVLKSSDSSFFTLFNGAFDTAALTPEVWSGGFVDVTVDAGMVGELLQIGFNNTATDWGPSDVFYDNLCFDAVGAGCHAAVVPVPAAVWLFGSGLLGLVGVARRKIG